MTNTHFTASPEKRRETFERIRAGQAARSRDTLARIEDRIARAKSDDDRALWVDIRDSQLAAMGRTA